MYCNSLILTIVSQHWYTLSTRPTASTCN